MAVKVCCVAVLSGSVLSTQSQCVLLRYTDIMFKSQPVFLQKFYHFRCTVLNSHVCDKTSSITTSAVMLWSGTEFAASSNSQPTSLSVEL